MPLEEGRVPAHVRVVGAVAVSLAVLAACDSRVIDGFPVAAAPGQQRSLSSGSTASSGLGAFCNAVERGARAITQSHGDLHVVLRSFERMNAVAPAAIRPDTNYIVNTIRHAFATRQIPDLTVLGRHTHAVVRWGAANCPGT